MVEAQKIILKHYGISPWEINVITSILEKKFFVEVKNVTLFRNKKTAEFPDAITSRGSKHLKTLIDAIKKGYKSYIVFLVQIEGMKYFKIAKDIDKDYYENYLIAKKSGVQFLAYKCKIDPKKIKIDKKDTQISPKLLNPISGEAKLIKSDFLYRWLKMLKVSGYAYINNDR